MAAYYNEHDPHKAAWLRELVRAGVVALGDVDERSITEVQPRDLAGYSQCHFFAGIGVWSYALFNAGWEDTDRVWTGSCPCQPFSQAGRQRGNADARHLWPEWLRLIDECRPVVVFGEQVASPLGRAWLDTVSTDLEALDYAVGSADLCAAGVGAPHIRQRLYFVADADGGGAPSVLADANGQGPQGRLSSELRERPDQRAAGASGPLSGFWRDAEWIPCRDGKARPVEPGAFPLAHGAPARVVRLRGYGDAIVAEVAQAFIEAYLDTREAA